MSAATVAVKEKPILFSGPMVRAILEGRKTQTRRVIKDGPGGDFWGKPQTSGYPGDPWYVTANLTPASVHTFKPCPYGMVGDCLWVRETHCVFSVDSSGSTASVGYKERISKGKTLANTDGGLDVIRVTPSQYGWAYDHVDCERWRPSIFMPRWASRLTLQITNIRVERLREISEGDAIAEGLTQWSDPPRITKVHYGESRADVWETDPRKAYARLWDTINAKRGYSWESNPFVWVVEFKKL